MAVHRFGNYRMHWKRPWRSGMTVLYFALYRTFATTRHRAAVQRQARAARGVRAPGAIVIHGNSVIGDDCIIRQA